MISAPDIKVSHRSIVRGLGMLVMLAALLFFAQPSAQAAPAPSGHLSVRHALAGTVLAGTPLTQWATALVLAFTDPGDSDGDGIDDDLDNDDDNDGIDDDLDDGDMDDDGIDDDVDPDDDGDGIDDELDTDKDNDGIDDSLDDGDMDDDGITDQADPDDDGDGIDDDIDPDDDNDGVPDTYDDGDVDDDGITDQADDDDLYEDAQLNGDSLTIATRMGEPGLATVTAVVDVSGVPTFSPLGGLRLFDSTGSSALTLNIPLLPELSGLVVSLDSFGVNPFGAIIQSHVGNATFTMP